MTKSYYRNLISIVLVVCMLILSGWVPEESILDTTNKVLSESNRFHNISDNGYLFEIKDAIVPSNSIYERSIDEYRMRSRKGNGNSIRQLRILYFSFILLCSVFAIPLLCSFYVRFVGEREQKLLIIKYIHNKDGLKSTSVTSIS